MSRVEEPSTATTIQRPKRVVVILAGSALLVVGAILGSVYGSRAGAHRNDHNMARDGASVRAPMETQGVPGDVFNLLLNANNMTVEVGMEQQQQQQQQQGVGGNWSSAGVWAGGGGDTGSPQQQIEPKGTGGGGDSSLGGAGGGLGLQGEDLPAAWRDAIKASIGVSANSSMVTLGSETGAWKALGGAGAVICYPQNGRDVVAMVNQPTCTVIILTNGRPPGYIIDEMMIVTSTKVIIGHPVSLPALNASRIERLFDVRAGGRLDLRFVRLLRGSGVLLQDNTLVLVSGASVRVMLGGHFTATGCVFTDRPQTLQGWLQDLEATNRVRTRTFGGHILVIGGNLYMQGCRFVAFYPYGSPLWNSINVGGQILVVAGNVLSFGEYHVGFTAFQNAAMVGNVAAVLGGTYTWVGGGLATAAGMQSQWAAGSNVFVGGGVFVTIGFQFATANGALMRMGFGEFAVGAGVYINVGYTFARAWAVGCQFGLGQSHAVGSGIMGIYGGTYATTAVAAGFFGLGASVYVGSGHFAKVLVPRCNANVVLTQFGGGFNFWNGAGTINLISSPSFLGAVARFGTGLATEAALGAGWGNFISSPRYAFLVVNVLLIEGAVIWVGAGGAFFYRNLLVAAQVWSYVSSPYAFTVAGTGVPTGPVTNSAIIVTKKGASYPENHTMDNSTWESDKWSTKGPARTRFLPSKPVPKALPPARGMEGEQNNSTRPSKAKLMMMDNYMEDITVHPSRLDFSKVSAEALKDWSTLLSSSTHREEYWDMIRGDTPAARQQAKPWLVSVNNTDACYICGAKPGPSASHYGGPDQCDVHNECNAAASADGASAAGEVPPVANWALNSSGHQQVHSRRTQPQADGGRKGRRAGQQGLSGAGDADGDGVNNDTDDELEAVPDTVLLWHDVVAYCTGRVDACVGERDVKTAVRSALGVDADYAVAVASTAFHPSIMHLVSPDLVNAMVPEERADCPIWARYNVYTTTNDAQAVNALKAAWADLANDTCAFTAALQSSLYDRQSDAEICAVDAKVVTSNVYPTSFDRMPAFNPAVMGTIGPSVVVGSDRLFGPPVELVAGQRYQVFLQNFPSGADVVVKVREALAVDGRVLKTVKAFSDDGTEKFVLVAPKKMGRYYLHAYHSEMPVIFAFSGIFETVTKATHPTRRW